MPFHIQELKHVLITGATSGIGLALAQRLAESYPSLQLSLIGRSPKKIEKIMQDFSIYGDRVRIYQYDFNEITSESIQEILQQSINNRNPIDGFVHCAGEVTEQNLRNFNIAKSHALFNQHFVSFVELVRLLSKHKPSQKNGVKSFLNIVAISSIATQVKALNNEIYGAVKASMEHIVKEDAQLLLKKNIMINGFRFALVDTPLLDCLRSIYPSEEDFVRASEHPLGIIDLSSCVDLLEQQLMHPNPYVTGTMFNVSSGIFM